MNRDDIIRMAAQVESEITGHDFPHSYEFIEWCERFATLVASAEHKWFVQILSRVVMSDVTHEMLIDVIKRRGEKYAPDSMETSVASSGSDSKKD